MLLLRRASTTSLCSKIGIQKFATGSLNACLAIRKQLLKCEVRRISFIIHQQNEEVTERWLFDVEKFLLFPEEEALTKLDDLGGAGVNLVDFKSS